MRLLNFYLKQNMDVSEYYEEIFNSEVWEPIIVDGIELEDEVSSYGNVRFKNGNGRIYHALNGYDFVYLCDDRLKDMFTILCLDELVATTFLPIPYEVSKEYDEAKEDKDNLRRYSVNHKDGDTRNTKSCNLEWYVEKEEWEKINLKHEALSEYQISTFGRVRRFQRVYKSWVYLTCSPNGRGYRLLQVQGKDMGHNRYTVHKLVATMVYGESEFKNPEVNHINLKKTDNYWKNLEWVDHDLNMKHAFTFNKNIDMPQGEKSVNSKITNDVAEKICQLLVHYAGDFEYSTKVYNDMLKLGYDVPITIIKHIHNKEGWTFISDKYFDKDFFTKKRTSDIHVICQTIAKNKYDDEKTLNELIDKIPWITPRVISDIRLKERYTDISDKYFTKDGMTKPRSVFTLKGEDSGTAKLSTENVECIINKLIKYKGMKGCVPIIKNEMKQEYGIDVCISTIEGIKNKRSWTSVSDKYFKSPDYFKTL